MSAAVEWQPDILGEGYEQTVFELGPDPGDVPLGFGLMPSGIGRS